ncbi:hypothetical protein [Bacillus albus]|uniref:Uncharacterized protein n=1 Tax=Bacillus albus TaxID=2026189 RepID=A0A1J9TFN7_9BACI|nr:hypothetical protein [Bacillus albus]OJD65046.1 hypothetical protein BAU25_01210 [Bacillus albus]
MITNIGETMIAGTGFAITVGEKTTIKTMTTAEAEAEAITTVGEIITITAEAITIIAEAITTVGEILTTVGRIF